MLQVIVFVLDVEELNVEHVDNKIFHRLKAMNENIMIYLLNNNKNFLKSTWRSVKRLNIK
jgi:hypothetical protein